MSGYVLIIEDNESIAGLEKRHLEREGFSVKISTNGADALAMIKSIAPPEILIIDYALPDMSGVELMKEVKAAGLAIPSVIVTALGSETVAVEAMKLGALDYIVKDTETIRQLPATCREVLKKFNLARENARLMDELKKVNTELLSANARLEDISRKDELTGVFNRRHLMESLDREISFTRRYKTPLTLALLDLDFFKTVNDTHGHIMGDTVLRQFGELLVNRLRKTDIIGRYGGEEFAVILTGTGLKNSMILCEQLRQSVESNPFGPPELGLRVTFSMGIGEWEKPMDLDALVMLADRGLYQAKELGRNRVVALQMASR